MFQKNHINLLHWTKAKANFILKNFKPVPLSSTLYQIEIAKPICFSLCIKCSLSFLSLSHLEPRCQIQPLPCIAGPARSEFVSFENLENHLYSISSIIVRTCTTFSVIDSNTQRHKGVIFPFYLLLFNTFSHLFHFLFIYLQTTAGRHI